MHGTVPGGLLVVENLIFTSDGSHEDPADLRNPSNPVDNHCFAQVLRSNKVN